MKMNNLKTFSVTRFPNSVRAVFDTLIEDYRPIVKCLEDVVKQNESCDGRQRGSEAKAILRKILSKSFVLKLCGISDIYENVRHISNLSQIVDIFPHERFDSVMRAIETFEIMSKCVSQDQCLKD